jgi:hypothetical protein
MAILNLFVSIYLCQKFGAIGSAIGTALSLIICNGIIMNVYYLKKCNLDIIRFWKNIICMFRAFIPPIIFAVCMHFLWIDSSLIAMFFKIVVYTMSYCISMWCFAMNDYEKNLLKKPILSFFNKKRKA